MPEETPTRVPTLLGDVAVRELGEGRPTLLWHSMFVDGASWSPMLPFLRSGRRLLVVDGPGWGRSAALRRTTTVEGAVAAAEQLLARLAPGEPVDWVGNAWGGHVGMGLAATRPDLVRSLVAISSPTQPIDAALRRRIRLLLPVLLTVGPIAPVRGAVLEGLLTDASRERPDLAAVVADALARSTRASIARSVRSFILNRVDIGALLPRIHAPCLFVTGDDRGDWSAQQAEWAAMSVPSARVVVVGGTRTLVPIERPAELAEEILEFWREIGPA